MISAADLPLPDAINLNLAAISGEDAIRELHRGWQHVDAVLDPDRLLRDLLERQALGANCLDREVAIPHARTTSVNRIVLAVGRSENGVRFDGQHPSIRLVFLIAVPIDAVTEYLQRTALLARALRDPAGRRNLLQARTADELRAAWPVGPGLPKPRS